MVDVYWAKELLCFVTANFLLYIFEAISRVEAFSRFI